MCTFGLLGCRVKPRRLRGRWGSTRQPENFSRGSTRHSENSKRGHFRVPALQTPPKFHEWTEREERMKIVAVEGKKERNFGPTLRGHTLRDPTLRDPGCLFCAFFHLVQILAKVGHPNFGQSPSNKDGQSRFGQSWSQPQRVCTCNTPDFDTEAPLVKCNARRHTSARSLSGVPRTNGRLASRSSEGPKTTPGGRRTRDTAGERAPHESSSSSSTDKKSFDSSCTNPASSSSAGSSNAIAGLMLQVPTTSSQDVSLKTQLKTP